MLYSVDLSLLQVMNIYRPVAGSISPEVAIADCRPVDAISVTAPVFLLTLNKEPLLLMA